MNAVLRRRLAVTLVCLFLFTSTRQAKADDLGRDVVLVFVGVIAVTAAITVGIVYAVRHKPSITGCTVEESNGLVLRNESDGKTYALTGALAKLVKGQRVRVSGKKLTTDGGVREFQVEKVTKNLGACTVQPATP